MATASSVNKFSKTKHRKKIQETISQRVKETGKDEAVVKKEVLKELRNERREKKDRPQAELKKIEKKVKKEMKGQPKEAIKKATAKAVAQFYSQRKKAKLQPVRAAAVKIVQKRINDKWCPREESWFDGECEQAYNSIFLLGAMLNMNIEKNTDEFEKTFPNESASYFDLLAKKRFSAIGKAEKKPDHPEDAKENEQDEETSNPKPAVAKKKKTKLEKALNEKLSNNIECKSEQELIKQVILESKAKEARNKVKLLRKSWFPVNQAWYDQECKDYAEKISAKATELGLDLKACPADFRRLKEKSSGLVSGYFKILQEKKGGHSKEKEKEDKIKNKNKKKKKKAKSTDETEEALPEEDDSNRVNKKIKFSEEDTEDAEDNADETMETDEPEDAGDLVQDLTIEDAKKKSKKVKKTKTKKHTESTESPAISPAKNKNENEKAYRKY